MSERLQELVELFLHRGGTPEQERELFDACLHNPEAAETVRQQLVLSLKIRQLKQQAEVPTELRNELFRKINAIAAEETAKQERKPAFAWLRQIRLGWSHAAVATVTAAVALFFVSIGTDVPTGIAPSEEFASIPVADTVTIVTVDTLREVREVRVPVYIDRAQIAKNETSPETEAAEDGIAVTDNGSEMFAADDNTAASEREGVTGAMHARIERVQELEVSRSDYLDQYTMVVANAERVQLTSDDRVRF